MPTSQMRAGLVGIVAGTEQILQMTAEQTRRSQWKRVGDSTILPLLARETSGRRELIAVWAEPERYRQQQGVG